MCLPASGTISISQIRDEIYNNGCGPSTYSLGALAGYAGFPADPDAMSEFYNYCCNITTTTTAAPTNCHDYQATATSYMTFTDCCGNPQTQYLNVGDTFCAEVGTVYGYYIDLGTNCTC